MSPLSTGVVGNISFHMQFHRNHVYLLWSDNRPHETRPVHIGEDPQEIMNNWKEELCN